MLAELNGKVVNDRSEDELTGNFFGVLRYASFNNLLRRVLSSSIYPRDLSIMIDQIDCDEWSDLIEFWPHDVEGELDVRIDFPTTIIGIEVKYRSGLSSDDDVDNAQSDIVAESRNQLAREARILVKHADGRKKLLLFITPDLYCNDVYHDVISRRLLPDDVSFGYASWQEIFISLRSIETTNPFEAAIVNDLIALLQLKGFDDFKSMSIHVPFDVTDDRHYKFKADDPMDSHDAINLQHSMQVLIKTYENIEKLLKHCELAARDAGYECMTPWPRFLRWRSDKEIDGWSLRRFMLLFQRLDDATLDNGWRDGYIYGLRIALSDQQLPLISVIRYSYDDIESWQSNSSPADFYYFDDPLYARKKFAIDESGRYVMSTPRDDRTSQRYRGIKAAVWRDHDLFNVTADNVDAIVFGGFDELADYVIADEDSNND